MSCGVCHQPVGLMGAEQFLIPVALLLLAVGADGFPHGPLKAPLSVSYMLALGCFALWSYSESRTWMTLTCAILFAASLTRTISFAYEAITRGDRISGIGINILVMLYCVRLNRDQERERCA